jgi:hypothetical protein
MIAYSICETGAKTIRGPRERVMRRDQPNSSVFMRTPLQASFTGGDDLKGRFSDLDILTAVNRLS